MKARVYIMPKEGILDPQGLTVGKALHNLGISQIASVHMGKYVEITLPDITPERAREVTAEACDRLLVNPNIETYRFDILEEEK